jgi:hypothetical protein
MLVSNRISISSLVPSGPLDDQNNGQSEKKASNKKLAFLFARNFSQFAASESLFWSNSWVKRVGSSPIGK